MSQPDPHYKKTVTLEHGGRRLALRVAQELFSSHEVDVGTRLLLRTLGGPEHRGHRLVLDLGCGYGPLGLGLAAAEAGRTVHLVDRDALAVEYTLQNAAANGLDGVQAYGSLGYADVRASGFDLIVSNVPAKAGPPVVEHFLLDAAGVLAPGGLVAVVVIASLQDGDRPTLAFAHLMFPHVPWEFLPSGRRYDGGDLPGFETNRWGDDSFLVEQGYQRYLLQLGFADRLLGEIVGRLRSTGMYERALFIVVADHGVSFRAGEKRRPLSSANLEDIAYVPLFVKLPRQERGRVVERPARTIDILPTLADALGVRLPWHVDGRSLLRLRQHERFVVLIKDHGRRFTVPAAQLEARRERALRRQMRLFGSRELLSTLFAVGPDRGLLGHPFEGGRRVADLDPVDLSGPLVQVSGRVAGAARSVVVLSAGRVVAVDPVAEGRFWALVPRASLNNARPKVFAVRP